MQKGNPSFRRIRTTKEQAQIEQKKTFNCQHCSKSYLSYPALYTHSKNKHQGQPISSKSSDDTSGNVPVKKLKSILNETKSPSKQQLERKLLTIAKIAQLELYQTLNKHISLQLGEVESNFLNRTQEIAQSGETIAKQIGIPSELYSTGYDSEIFKEQHTRVSKISLGGDMLKFFTKTQEGARVYLQILLLEHAPDAQIWEDKLWNRRIDLKFLHNHWEEWKATTARLRSLQNPEVQQKKQEKEE